MAEHTATVESPKPAEEAFAYVVALDNAEEWDPNCVSAERLTPGAVRVGTRFRLVFKAAAVAELELLYEVREWDPPHRMVVVADGDGPVRAEDEIVVEPRGTGSAVTWTARLEGEGVAKLAGPLFSIGVERATERGVKGLGEALAG